MAVTPIDALFFAAAAYLGKRGLDESKPRDPSDVLPPGLDPPPVTPDVRDGDPIPDLCVGSSIVMPRDRQLMALTEPAGLTHQITLTSRVRTIHYEIDAYDPAQRCWVTIRRHDNRMSRNRFWPVTDASATRKIGIRWQDGEDDSGRVQPQSGRYRIRISAPGSRIGGAGGGWLDFGTFDGEYHDPGLGGVGGGSTGGGPSSGGGGGMLGNSSAALSAARTARLAPHMAGLGGLGKGGDGSGYFLGEDGSGWIPANPDDALGIAERACCMFGIASCCPSLRVPTPTGPGPLPGPTPPALPIGGNPIPWVPILAVGGLGLGGLVWALSRR